MITKETNNIFYIVKLISLTHSSKQDRETFDDLHRCMVRDAQRQSERDFPRMSIRNGLNRGIPTRQVMFLFHHIIIIMDIDDDMMDAILNNQQKSDRPWNVRVRRPEFC